MNINRNNEIKQKAQGINPYIVPRNLDEISALGGGSVLFIIVQGSTVHDCMLLRGLLPEERRS